MRNKKMRRYLRSATKKKILLLLCAGIALGLATNPYTQRRIFRKVVREWKYIDRQKLYRTLTEFEKRGLLRYKQRGGNWEVELTEKGRRDAQRCAFEELEIKKPKTWDRKWRLALFDIPEKKKIVRDALRQKLQKLGFVELQKSVFVYPYPCKGEIEAVGSFFNAQKFITTCIVTEISDEKMLRKIFSL